MHAARFSPISIKLTVAAREAQCECLADKAVLLLMATYGPLCWAHQQTIAGRLGAGVRTVRRAWARLAAAGHIAQAKRTSAGVVWHVQPGGIRFTEPDSDRSHRPVDRSHRPVRPVTQAGHSIKGEVKVLSGRMKAERPKAGLSGAERPAAGHPDAGASGRSRLGSDGDMVFIERPGGVQVIELERPNEFGERQGKLNLGG